MKRILTLLFLIFSFFTFRAQTLQIKMVADLRSASSSFAFSPDNHFLAVGGYTLRIYKIEDDKPVIYKTISDCNGGSPSFTSDGKYLVVNSDKTYIYSVTNDFKLIKTFTSSSWISQFNKSSEYFLIQESDSLFNVYEIKNDEFILKSSTNEYFYGISPNNNYLYSRKRDSNKDAVILFTFNNGEINYLKKIKTINSNDYINIQSVGFSQNEQFLTIDYSTNNNDLDNVKSFKDIYSFNNFNFTYVQTIFLEIIMRLKMYF
ncbi:MAG: hypothetical protein JXR68_06345 [Bacteroidales bacterium]|nr:hypothetical protein [Bacteroidales bacterium]